MADATKRLWTTAYEAFTAAGDEGLNAAQLAEILGGRPVDKANAGRAIRALVDEKGIELCGKGRWRAIPGWTQIINRGQHKGPLVDKLPEPEIGVDVTVEEYQRQRASRGRKAAAPDPAVDIDPQLAALMTPDERRRYRLYQARTREDDWRVWVPSMFPTFTSAPFAEHHERFWEHVWSIELGKQSIPHVDIWARGGGKALAVDTPLPTPTGWTTMGAVRVGDTVFDETGTPCRVTRTSKVETKSCYRVRFKGGGYIDASGDHLWTVLSKKARSVMYAQEGRIVESWPAWRGGQQVTNPCDIEDCGRRYKCRGPNGERWCGMHWQRWKTHGNPLTSLKRKRRGPVGLDRSPRSKPETLTTEQIADRGLRQGQDWKFTIPVAREFDLPDVDVPIDPWTLGLWLGDGTKRTAQITVGAEDADETQAGLEVRGYTVTRSPDTNGAFILNPLGLNRQLRAVGLLSNKHIPAVYLRASVKQRTGLLAGLLDSDGWANKGAAEFVNTNRRIVDGVHELAVSLGYRTHVREGRATLYGRDCGPKWTVYIAGGGDLFQLARKRATSDQVATLTRNAALHAIQAIDRLPDQPVKCITVDSPNHLFLAGRDAVPTHNSVSAETAVAALGCRNKRRYVLYVSATESLADEHVESIATLLASEMVQLAYPDVANPEIGKHGQARAWRRSRLRTASGFTVDALGLDVAARGKRIDEQRPDLICHEAGTPIFDEGRWMKVEDHPGFLGFREETGVEVAVWGLTDPEHVTREHRYWTRELVRRREPGRYVYELSEPGWTEAQHLTTSNASPYRSGHWIGCPIDQTITEPPPIPVYQPGATVERDKTTGRIAGSSGAFVDRVPAEFNDPDWWWLVGLWWGDGHVAGPYQVGLTVADTQPEILARVQAVLAKYAIAHSLIPKVGCSQVIFSCAWMNRWLRTWKHGNSRKEPPAWVETMSPTLQAGLARGYVDADGHVVDAGNGAGVYLTSIHLPGLRALRRILARLGIAASIRKGAGARVETFPNGVTSVAQPKFDLRFRNGAEALGLQIAPRSRYQIGRTFIADGFLWAKVRSASPLAEPTKFAPIVTATHTYVTDFGLSHNCFDDIDDTDDTPATIKKKIRAITRKLLPTGSQDVTVIAVQNKVHANSIFARLMSTGGQDEPEPADWLTNRIVVGPIPAVWGLQYEQRATEGGRYRYVITGGEPSWVGMPLESCQDMIDTYGIDAFLAECQHDEADLTGSMFGHLDFTAQGPIRIPEFALPPLRHTCVWVDPAVSKTDKSDSCGVVVDSLGADGLYYRRWAWERIAAADEVLEVAVGAALDFGADVVGVETDQGGGAWEVIYRQVLQKVVEQRIRENGGEMPDGMRIPRYEHAKAGSAQMSKVERIQRMASEYNLGRFRHVEGNVIALERGLRRFPEHKPYDVVDAAWHSWRWLATHGGDPGSRHRMRVRAPSGGVGEVTAAGLG